MKWLPLHTAATIASLTRHKAFILAWRSRMMAARFAGRTSSSACGIRGRAKISARRFRARLPKPPEISIAKGTNSGAFEGRYHRASTSMVLRSSAAAASAPGAISAVLLLPSDGPQTVKSIRYFWPSVRSLGNTLEMNRSDLQILLEAEIVFAV